MKHGNNHKRGARNPIVLDESRADQVQANAQKGKEISEKVQLMIHHEEKKKKKSL